MYELSSELAISKSKPFHGPRSPPALIYLEVETRHQQWPLVTMAQIQWCGQVMEFNNALAQLCAGPTQACATLPRVARFAVCIGSTLIASTQHQIIPLCCAYQRSECGSMPREALNLLS